MTITVSNRGGNNTIAISDSALQSGQGSISINGDNNRIKIKDSIYNIGININLGSGCTINIGSNINCRNLFIHMGDDASLDIGDLAGFNGVVRLLMHEPSSILIGKGCLIADQVDISTSDMHSILDASTNTRLNPAKSIRIGDRVWIGQRCMIMKGIELGAGSICGAGSIVTRNIPENSVAAGNPARIIRKNVTWDFRIL